MGTKEFIVERRKKADDIVGLPSTGKKWWISDELMKEIECDHEPANCYREFYYSIKIGSLTLRVCYRNEASIRVFGIGGYIGLSHHDDGWHIGTPAHALSQPLIDAMDAWRGD